MANSYFVTLKAVADDGTNTYLFIEISNGTRTMPTIQTIVPSGTSVASIRTYLQNIATNQPTIAAGLQSLVNVSVAGQ